MVIPEAFLHTLWYSRSIDQAGMDARARDALIQVTARYCGPWPSVGRLSVLILLFN